MRLFHQSSIMHASRSLICLYQSPPGSDLCHLLLVILKIPMALQDLALEQRHIRIPQLSSLAI